MSQARNELCWCGSGKKWKKCHYSQPPAHSSQDALRVEYQKKYNILLKNPQQIEGIRRACHLTSHILEETCKRAVAGVTTDELNTFAQEMTLKAGARAASLHYGSPPFPKSICTSLNEVICHGIPGNQKLQEGDILNVDIACILDGYYGDCSKMVCVGKVSAERQRVVDVAYECLMRSVAPLAPGVPLSTIGKIIQDYATSHGCSVVYQFVAHGVGVRYHEAPQIPHYANTLHLPLAPGMTFTVEPMINAGSPDAVIDPEDQWTARTADGRASAQWEHTVLITETGHELLTNWKR